MLEMKKAVDQKAACYRNKRMVKEFSGEAKKAFERYIRETRKNGPWRLAYLAFLCHRPQTPDRRTKH